MARKRLILHLFPAFVALGIAVLGAVTLYAGHSFHVFYYNQVRDDLEVRAHLIESQIGAFIQSRDFEALDQACKTLAAKSKTRFTIILEGGRVVGDSFEDPKQMQDHSDRPEFRAALEEGQGQSIRFSSTVGKNMMYLAVPLTIQGEIAAVIRASVPVTVIEQELGMLYERVLWATIFVAACAALFSYHLSKKISRPIEIMKETAKRFASGDFSHSLPLPDAAETAELAEALNEMAQQLRSRIETITADKNRMQAVLSGMIEGVMVFDSDSRLIDINKAAAEYLRIDRKPSLGRHIVEVVRNPQFQQFVADTLSGHDAFMETELAIHQDSQQFFQLHGRRLNGGDGPVGAVIVLHETTQVHRLEQIRRDFVANVSHELKTPITSIKGFVETLQEGSIDNPEEAGRFLEIIARHADRLNAIVDDLLSLSRLEEDSKNRSLFFEDTPLRPALAAAVELSSYKAEKKKITVEFSCDDKISAKVNPALIEQAVLNLIDNAIKYSQENSTIQVQAEKAAGEIVVHVRDQGCGIAPEHLSRIFERFYVVDKGRSRKLGGTGLGLAIVKHIAQVHGGRVEVTSRMGLGSTFSLHLPPDHLAE